MEPLVLTRKTNPLLVVQLIDLYTSSAPRDPRISVIVPQLIRGPIRKSGGLFVFQDVAAGHYDVQVQSDLYFAETVQVDTSQLDPLNPLVTVVLTPGPAYPFGEGDTLVRTSLRDSRGTPVRGMRVRATVTTESCARARLAQEGESGGDTLALNRVMGRLHQGERLLVKGAEDEQGEVCTILQEPDVGARSIKLSQPLQQTHPRGALLLPVVETRSDARGEVVLAFGNYRTKRFEIRLEFLAVAGSETGDIVKEVMVEEGLMTGLGLITV
jgi:hypothetical protein